MVDQELICKAIHGQNYVRLYYKNHAPNWHIVEPYALGNDHSGKLILAAWEWKGTIGKDSQGIQYYTVDAITEFEIDSAMFDRLQPGYNPADRRFHSVECDFLTSRYNMRSTGVVPPM